MAKLTLGLLHPGEMGSAIGATARSAGARVLWNSEQRSSRTYAQAAAAGLEDAGSLEGLVARSDLIFSVCPPHAALQVARDVAELGYAGTYVDANAVSAATVRQIAAVMETGGASFVDGGIIGPPPVAAASTRLYLSGGDAAIVARIFRGSALEAIEVNGPIGSASALKMAYAAWTKGSAALLIAVRALALAEGVDEALRSEWQLSIPDLAARSEAALRSNARKAWRFTGEMDEIASTFAAVGLPDGFHRAAREIYGRLAGYKDAATPPPLSDAARSLIRTRPRAYPETGTASAA